MDRPGELRAEDSQTAFLVSGWLLAAFSVLIPVLVIGAVVFARSRCSEASPGTAPG